MTAKELEALNGNYDMASILEVIKNNSQTKGVVDSKAKWEEVVLYKAGGCERCGNEGYKGRSGIYEVLEVDAEMEKMISQKASTEEVEKKAREKGMLTMVEDGFIKAVNGITSIEEILRVTKE